jgi:hypothetical protein
MSEDFEAKRLARIDVLLAEGALTQEQAEAMRLYRPGLDSQRINDELELRVAFNQADADAGILRDEDGRRARLYRWPL